MSIFGGLFGRKKPDIRELQTPLLEEICGALIDLLPENWTEAVYELTVSHNGDDTMLGHSIRSPQGHHDIVVAGPQLQDATRRLQLLCNEHGQKFKKIIFRVQSDPEGEWEFDSNWEY